MTVEINPERIEEAPNTSRAARISGISDLKFLSN